VFTKLQDMLTRIKSAWRDHRAYIITIFALVALFVGAVAYVHAVRAEAAETLLSAKVRVWYVRQSFVDVRGLPGGDAILDTLVVNGLDSTMAILERLPIPNPAR
jgi:hypothetical protein